MKHAVKAPATPADIKASLNSAYHQDENEAVAALLPDATFGKEAQGRIRNTARTMIERVRDSRKKFGGLDRFLNEFGLTTREGIALMCLAEALLRIPDSDTADKMIRDKIGTADWDKHLGKADDLFVNASTWALMLTGKVVADVEEEKGLSISGITNKIVSRLGEPVVRQAMMHAMKIMGHQFVMGRSIGEALMKAEEHEKAGYRYSYDMLGEGARTFEDAARYMKSYEMAIHAIGKAAVNRGVLKSPGISVKLSAIYPRFEYAKKEECVPALTQQLLALAQRCAQHDISLTVDAEEANRLEISLDVIRNVFTDPSLGDWQGFGLAVQAYQKRCGAVIDWLAALAKDTGRRMMVRLVKGAYWDSEIKYAQVNGLPGYPVFTRKASTDVSYVANAKKLMAHRDVLYPMFATHNAYTVATVIELAGDDKTGFEFQRLHGMGEPLYHQIIGHTDGKYPCRIYAPVGLHQDLLPYLVRRLLENGANTNFVNRLQDDSVPVDDMLGDPAEYIAAQDSKPHPKIPLPADIYGPSRKNSSGIEFADGTVSADWIDKVEKFAAKTYTAGPLVLGTPRIGAKTPVHDPSDITRIVGTVSFATAEDIEHALQTTHAGFAGWNATSAHDRALCLERMAAALEENAHELAALCVREAGKTLPDAVAEIREAVDFCRYYAVEGRKHFGQPEILPGPTGESNTLQLEGRGVFLCISPWNFPLAIFIGQVAAALMAGNTVIAKPAGQTTLIAYRAAELLIQSGVPKDAIALLPVSGGMAGAHLVPDERVAGICFTGSTDTAKTINRTLAAREGAIVPLIAETGGQNAMVADSSALPEQIVDDVITSAFRSAGQRCSALRVLYVQDVIADKVIAMLNGACETLSLGDPLKLSTDIGPVIDRESLAKLESHAQRMKAEGKCVARVPLPAGLENGTFFAPAAFEIKSIDQLTGEVFGPILHIIRFRADDMDDVIRQINSTGFGLTFGVHTRIDHAQKKLCRQVRAGNCYVNRSMIGAVVGVQPFGGQGLSGTGPKAGGPHYLPRFATERTVSVNTTASGGNTTLVSLSED